MILNAFLSQKQREEIGFNFVINKLDVLSVYGNELLNTQSPYQSTKLLNEEFSRIELVKSYLTDEYRLMNESEIYLARIKNIDSILTGLDLVCLDEVDIFEIKKFTFNVIKLNTCYKKIYGLINSFTFFNFSELFNFLDQDLSNMPFFSLYDQYSEKMADLRRQVKNNELNEKELEELKIELKNEELEVRIMITNYIAKYQDDLIATTKQIAYVDLLIAKAKLALEYNLNKPMIYNDIELIDSYNPLVKKIVESNGYKYTPLNIELKKDIQLVTGSNMSGKSVTLKNIILNALCFQYGIFPFAKGAKFPILDYIVYISDELQDVENSLSSFGKEVHVLSETLEFIKNKNGLIVLDEFARGTNPIEAKMIVVGLCKYLKKQEAYCILSTHLDLHLDIDYTHYQVAGLSNFDEDLVTSDDILRVMDYSLIKVDAHTKVPNDAFKVMNFLNSNRELKELIKKEYEKEIENEQN